MSFLFKFNCFKIQLVQRLRTLIQKIKSYIFYLIILLISKNPIYLYIIISITTRYLCGTFELYMDNPSENGPEGNDLGGSGGPSNPGGGGGPDPNYMRRLWNGFLASRNGDWWNRLPDNFNEHNFNSYEDDEPEQDYDNWSKQELEDEYKRLKSINTENRTELLVELNRMKYSITELVDRLSPEDRRIEDESLEFIRRTNNQLASERDNIINRNRINHTGIRYQEASNNQKVWETYSTIKRKENILKKLNLYHNSQESREFYHEDANSSQILKELGKNTKKMKDITESISRRSRPRR